MPRMKKIISVPPVQVDPNARFSYKVVGEVLGLKHTQVTERAGKMGIKTHGHGYSAADAKRIRDFQPSVKHSSGPKGTPDQLRFALSAM